MPTVQVKTVIPGGGGDYTSLSAWEAAQQADLVALDLIKIAQCYPGIDANQCTLAGWTTDPTHFIGIYGVGVQSATLANTVYRIRTAAVTTGLLRNLNLAGAKHVRIDNIQLFPRNASCDGIRQNDGNSDVDWRISRCMILNNNNTTCDGNYGINFFGPGSLYCWNNAISGFNNSGGPVNPPGGIRTQVAAAKCWLYANTIHDCYNGLWGELSTRVVNNLLRAVTVAEWVTSGGFHADSGFNASELSSGPGINNSVGPIILAGDVTATVDLHLDVSDVVARRHGVDLSVSVLPFDEDFEGTPRGAVWDCGWDQTYTELVGFPDTMRVYFDQTGRHFRWKGEDEFTFLGPGGFGGGGGGEGGTH